MKIKLSESKLKQIVMESVKKVLKEEQQKIDIYEKEQDILNGEYDELILNAWEDFLNDLYDDNGWDTTLKDAAETRKKFLSKNWVAEIEKGYCDEEILDNWHEFYHNLPFYIAKKAAKKRKEFLELIFNNKFSKEWNSYVNTPDFMDKFWGAETVNESIWDSPSEWQKNSEQIDSLLNLIFSNKYKVRKGVKEMLTKILNAKTYQELEELFWETPRYKEFSELMQKLIKRQQTMLDSNYALTHLDRPSAIFNDKRYQGPNVDFFKGNEKDDEMWGKNDKRIRRLDKFIDGKNMNNKKIERAVVDNIIKHDLGGRDYRKEKLHTKGSANRDLIAIDKSKL